MPNQVLEGVQQRLSQRLQSDLQGDAENRKAQAEGLHKVIWSPDATDEQRERAQVALEKLYPHSKDLLGKVREVSSKVFGFLKAPPGVAETGQQKSSEILSQADSKESAVSQGSAIDPDVARVYSGIGLPSGLAPSLPPPPGMAGDPGAGATPAPVTMPQARTSPAPQTPLAPPPSMTQDIGSVVRTGMARTKQEEIDKANRAAEIARESKRMEIEQGYAADAELQGLRDTNQAAREKAAREGQYREPFAVSGNVVLNKATGEWEQLPPEATKPDQSMTIPEIAMIAADPSDPRSAQAQEAMKKLVEMNKAQQSDTSILLNQLRSLQVEEKTGVSPGQVINRATGRPVNLAASEAVLLKDLKFLQDQTQFVDKLLQTAGDTGAIKGWVTVQGMTLPVVQDQLSPEHVELAAEIQRLNNAYVYAMTGKQINENETVRLALTAPNIRYTPEINRRMVTNFGRAAKASVDGFLEVNGWAFAPGVRGAGAGAGATPPPSGNNAAGTGAPAAGAGRAGSPAQRAPGTRFEFNGRTYVIQPDGSAKEAVK